MSRLRHKEEKRAKGGSVKETVYAGEGSNVLKEAEERKKGGRVKHMEGEGEMPKMRGDRAKRARGGAVPGRKKGGAVGADSHPLSSAAKVKEVTKGETPEMGVESD
jgi:hypothetical protein